MRMQPTTDASVKVQLLAPSVLQPGRPITLRYQLSEVRSAMPLTDVVLSHERLIHLIVVRQDLRHFQHLHPKPTNDAPFGPEIKFRHTFPAPGLYKVWGQCQTNVGQVITADFTVRIH